MRVLVTGWFAFEHGEATAGDLLAARTVAAWLTRAGVAYDTALSPAFGSDHEDGGGTGDSGVVRLDRVGPQEYDHVVFVCGPVSGWQVAELAAQFRDRPRTAVGVSVVGDPAGARFDTVIARDHRPDAADEPTDPGTPDLALAAPRAQLPPVIGMVRAHPQPEYPTADPDEVHRYIDAWLSERDVTVLPVDTRVDPRDPGRRTSAQVEALLARVDAVVTTRLHGLVLALRHGVPALAVDPVPEGAKVAQQAQTLGWPAVLTASTLTAEAFGSALDWCLRPAAVAAAGQAARRGRVALGEVEQRLRAAIAAPTTTTDPEEAAAEAAEAAAAGSPPGS